MTHGKLLHDWGITSNILATLINCHVPKKSQVRADEINPMRDKKQDVIFDNKMGFAMLKKAFIGDQNPRRKKSGNGSGNPKL